MSELNTVCISTEEYKELLSAQFELEQMTSLQDNLVNYIERVEKVIFDLIRKETNHGEYDWKLRGEFKDIISVLNAHEVDWTEKKDSDDGAGELFEEIDGGYAE